VAVPDVKDLQDLSLRPEIEAAVGEDPVHVQDQQADGLGPLPDLRRVCMRIQVFFLNGSGLSLAKTQRRKI
jgi:hypothetical protein